MLTKANHKCKKTTNLTSNARMRRAVQRRETQQRQYQLNNNPNRTKNDRREKYIKVT